MPKKKRTTKFKVPSRKQPFFSIVKKLVYLFKFRKYKVINLAETVETKAIFVGNHHAKMGPLAYEIFLPTFNVKWGAAQMLGNYKSRFNYLRNVFYMQKQKMGQLYTKN